MSKFLLLLIAVEVVTDCARSRAAAASSSPAPGKKDLYISIRRTPCYGTCPIDKVEAFGDGTVRYTGERFVPRPGVYVRRLSPTELASLEKLLQESGFEAYQPLYDNPGVTDLPSVILTYRLNGREKSIICRMDCPPELPEKIERLRVFLAEKGDFQIEKGPETEEDYHDPQD